MKKLLCLLLAVILVMSLWGCVPNTEDLRGEIETPSSSANLRGEIEIPSTSTSTPDNKETQPPTTEPEFSLGKTESNRYYNDYFGISCALPADWVFYTDEEILELNNITMDSFDGDVAEALKNATIIYDMFAQNPNDFSSTNINMEKLSALQMLYLDLKSNVETLLPILEESYANMGYTNIQTSYTKVTVDGKEYDGMKIFAQIQGINAYSISFCYKKASYLVNVNVTTFFTDETSTLLSYYTIS